MSSVGGTAKKEKESAAGSAGGGSAGGGAVGMKRKLTFSFSFSSDCLFKSLWLHVDLNKHSQTNDSPDLRYGFSLDCLFKSLWLHMSLNRRSYLTH